MRVRPATPLSVVLFVAFALLLISVLSTPIIQAVPLGKFRDFSFGVFGWCKGSSCSSLSIGYNPNTPLGDNASDFDMPESVRDTLTAILIIHPVAALLTLIMFILAVASHFHAPSHSLRYLLIQFIFTVITFVVCLAAFVIDILLFIPHMAFGTYFVLAATVLVGISAVVTCSMRRVLKSRKSQRKMVAQNAEMSGENYYNREGPAKTFFDITPQPSIPQASGANGTTGDVLPTFATFEQKKEATVSDEQVPLRQQSPNSGPQNGGFQDLANTNDAAGALPPTRSASRDRYGNLVDGPPEGYGVARGPSMESMRSRGSNGYRGGRGGYGRGGFDAYGAPTRGRGGYNAPGRGGYGPRGGRGGALGPPRGGYGPPMRGGRGPPPGPYGNAGPYDRRPSPAEPYAAYGAYGRRPSDGYNQEPTNQSVPDVNAGYEPYNPAGSNYPRAESPPPMQGADAGPPGQAMTMEAGPLETNQGYYPQIRDNDSDVAGMVGLQQGRGPERPDTFTSEGSKYSGDEQYMPARAAWNQDNGRNSPHNSPPPNHVRPVAELGSNSPGPASRGEYYEDVDPRFAGQQAPSPYNQQPPPLEPAYDDARLNAGGARSPTGSERSNFTSISQRGVNPRWNPPPPMPNQYGPPRRPPPQQQRQDMILDNPDFQIPGRRPGGRGPGMVPGSAYPNGAL